MHEKHCVSMSVENLAFAMSRDIRRSTSIDRLVGRFKTIIESHAAQIADIFTEKEMLLLVTIWEEHTVPAFFDRRNALLVVSDLVAVSAKDRASANRLIAKLERLETWQMMVLVEELDKTLIGKKRAKQEVGYKKTRAEKRYQSRSYKWKRMQGAKK